MTKKKTADIEKETLERVDTTLATISGFLARWDTARNRPDEVTPEVSRVRAFYDKLSSWRNEALKAGGNDAARTKRLREFVDICQAYP